MRGFDASAGSSPSAAGGHRVGVFVLLFNMRTVRRPIAYASLSSTMDQIKHTGLVRGVRRWDAVALMINCIIGAGIFGIPSKAFALTGSYSLLALAACALVVA